MARLSALVISRRHQLMTYMSKRRLHDPETREPLPDRHGIQHRLISDKKGPQAACEAFSDLLLPAR